MTYKFCLFAFFIVLLSFFQAPPVYADDTIIGEGTLTKGLKYLREAQKIGDKGARSHGTKFDKLVIEFYDNMVDDRIAKKITKTFAADDIAHGYRIGNTEVWLQKRTPALGTSIDILVWDLEMDQNGKVTRARATGLDHHTVHPKSPNATEFHKKHWRDKKTTAKFWENSLKTKGIDTKVSMDPDKSFYWRDAAGNLPDDYSNNKNKAAGKALGSILGEAPVIKGSLGALGGSFAMVGTGLAATKFLNALKRFYRSPILARTRRLLNQGKYSEAKRYWKAQCMVSTTMHRDCDRFRVALAEASSLLSARTYSDFPAAMEMLFNNWEKDAKKARQTATNNATGGASRYLGCFVDHSSRVLNGHSKYGDASMTNGKCQSLCRNKNFSYAGTEYSRECFCGNTRPTTSVVAESNCNYKCNGNQQEMCGGYWHISIYKLN
jgi:WSC domain-containing protein